MIEKEKIFKALTGTLDATNLPELGRLYSGKVRDVYIRDDKIFMITTDRVSAFDVILGTIPFKGQILNQVANYWFDQSSYIMKNHIIDRPDPNVTVARKCKTLPVEIVVRGYISGSMWRSYSAGERNMYGMQLPEGLKRDQRFEKPIITPTTKAEVGHHDEPVSPTEIISGGLVEKQIWEEVSEKSLELFELGSKLSKSRGLILVDTKYEFGLLDGNLILIDEIHTPDSSRYWSAAEYNERFAGGKEQKMLDKENLRQWLLAKGYSGSGKPPILTDEVRVMLAEKYIELFETMTGQEFNVSPESVSNRIRSNLKKNGYLV